MPNTNVPAISHPMPDLNSLTNTVLSLKEGVESLSGQHGSSLNRAVTFADLIALGVLKVYNGQVTAGAGQPVITP